MINPYGLTYSSLQNYEDTAIAGFYLINKYLHYPISELKIGCDLNGDGDQNDDVWVNEFLMFKENPPGLDITERICEFCELN